MQLTNVLDGYHVGFVFIVAVLLMVAFIEGGFYLGQKHLGKPNKPQMAQVRAIMGASLGLLAFMLAFSFSIAQSHFEQRAAAYLLELNGINAAYRSAGMLDDGQEFAARDLIRQFVDSRIELTAAVQAGRNAEAEAEFGKSQQIEGRLWAIAEGWDSSDGVAEPPGVFVSSVLTMIQAGTQRLQAAVYNRIPPVIWVTLFMISLLAMVVMGYQGGLTGTRSRLATWTLAIIFSIVMTLVTDLDRPRMSLFSLNQQVMYDYQAQINRHMQSYYGQVGGRDQ